MDKIEKLELMDKILRELEDLKNSETSVLKKIAQIETENINLGNTFLEKSLPEIYESSDKAIESIDAIVVDFTAQRDKFVKDNNLQPKEEETAE